MKTVFVTVGTTSFNDLIVGLTSHEVTEVMFNYIKLKAVILRVATVVKSALTRYIQVTNISRTNKCCKFHFTQLRFYSQSLKLRGYTDVVLQVGRGSYIPDAHSCPGLRLEAFRFKESIAENIQRADLVISHAGKKLNYLYIYI